MARMHRIWIVTGLLGLAGCGESVATDPRPGPTPAASIVSPEPARTIEPANDRGIRRAGRSAGSVGGDGAVAVAAPGAADVFRRYPDRRGPPVAGGFAAEPGAGSRGRKLRRHGAPQRVRGRRIHGQAEPGNRDGRQTRQTQAGRYPGHATCGLGLPEQET